MKQLLFTKHMRISNLYQTYSYKIGTTTPLYAGNFGFYSSITRKIAFLGVANLFIIKL